MQERGQFLLDYIDLLLRGGEVRPRASATSRRSTTRATRRATIAARGRDRWVINSARAGRWYTRGFDNGSRLRDRHQHVRSIGALRSLVTRFFFENDPLTDERPAGRRLAAAD